MAPHHVLPPEVSDLLECSDASRRELAWERFLKAYSPLILGISRGMSWDHDATMDRYAYVVEYLKSSDCERLRAFDPAGTGKFTTWLTVVVRRLCLDFHRRRYGRSRKSSDQRSGADELSATRRTLADFVVDELTEDRVGSSAGNPHMELRRRQLLDSLRDAIASLGSDEQLLLSYRFADELSAREISQLMDFSTPFHVYRKVNRVLAILREDLERRGIDDATP